MENEIKLFGEDSTRLNSPVVYRHLLWAPMNLNHHPTDKTEDTQHRLESNMQPHCYTVQQFHSNNDIRFWSVTRMNKNW